jgi:hypothetical protein
MLRVLRIVQNHVSGNVCVLKHVADIGIVVVVVVIVIISSLFFHADVEHISCGKLSRIMIGSFNSVSAVKINSPFIITFIQFYI